MAVVTAVGGLSVTTSMPTLLNPWDQGFLWVVLAIQYIGVYFFLYNGVPLSRWASPDRKVELRQLELVWDQQRMLLRAFSFITFTILIGQVFTVLQIKYGKILNDADLWAQNRPRVLVNAAQLAFLVLGWWALVFARLLRRMEHVLLRMRRLGPLEGE